MLTVIPEVTTKKITFKHSQKRKEGNQENQPNTQKEKGRLWRN
jgi:hypothetical protein